MSDSPRKIRVGILFGGKSAEHEVSLLSAKNIIDAIDTGKYEVVPIGIDKAGRWHLPDPAHFLEHAEDPAHVALEARQEDGVALVPQSGGELATTAGLNRSLAVDVVFPILHGPFGEDGTVQGLLKLANVPFVGAGVLGSAVGMDKDVMKRLLRDAGIPIGKFLAFQQEDKPDFEQVTKTLGLPCFVKPANLGSSVGVSKVTTKEGFENALANAFAYDTKVLVEEFIDGRELECAVLGNQEPAASGVGEIIPKHEFYSYDAKYIDEQGASLEVPAHIPEDVREEARELAVRTFTTLCCEGLGRVDMFLKKDGTLLVNEINTMPGFTKISMYPRLWAQAGMPYPELIDRLISLALERFEREKRLKTSQ